MDESEIQREYKRTRTSGAIVEDVKTIVTASEIGRATVRNINTEECDAADRAVKGDLGEQEILKE